MKKRKIPERMCVSCREMNQKKALIRVVRLPDGIVKVDPTGKASGRGAYICDKLDCVMLAKKRKLFERNLNVADCGQLYSHLLTFCEADEDGNVSAREEADSKPTGA